MNTSNSFSTDKPIFILDFRGRLLQFNNMTINKAIAYYTGHGTQSKYYDVFLNTILECLKKGAYGEFSKEEREVLMTALKEGYDFRWLIGGFNIRGMLKILNFLRNVSIAKSEFTYYEPDRLSMLQRAIITDKNTRPFDREIFDPTCKACTLMAQTLYNSGYNLINDEYNPETNTFFADVVNHEDNKFICRINLMASMETLVSSYLKVLGIKQKEGR